MLNVKVMYLFFTVKSYLFDKFSFFIGWYLSYWGFKQEIYYDY